LRWSVASEGAVIRCFFMAKKNILIISAAMFNSCQLVFFLSATLDKRVEYTGKHLGLIEGRPGRDL